MPVSLFADFRRPRAVGAIEPLSGQRAGSPDLDDWYLLAEDMGELQLEYYAPESEASEILQRFQSLPPELDAYARFIRKYGWLGGWTRQTLVHHPDTRELMPEQNATSEFGEQVVEWLDVFGFVESAVDWELEVLEMSTSVMLWELLVRRDRHALRELIQPIEGSAVTTARKGRLRRPCGLGPC